jgi:membrane protein
VLSVFPGMIVLTSLLGVFGDDDTIDGLLRIVDQIGPQSAVDAVEGPARNVVESGAAGLALVLGLAGAFWAASGYVGAFMRAANVVYQVDEDRSWRRLRPLRLGITLALVTTLAVALSALLLTGPLAEAVGGEVGLASEAVDLWAILKWPALLLAVAGLCALLLYWAPNVQHRSIRAVLPGSLLATGLWLLGSAGFAAYVANFGSYSSTYGGLAGIVVFLVWTWLANVALLLGVLLNSKLARRAAS